MITRLWLDTHFWMLLYLVNKQKIPPHFLSHTQGAHQAPVAPVVLPEGPPYFSCFSGIWSGCLPSNTLSIANMKGCHKYDGWLASWGLAYSHLQGQRWDWLDLIDLITIQIESTWQAGWNNGCSTSEPVLPHIAVSQHIYFEKEIEWFNSAYWPRNWTIHHYWVLRCHFFPYAPFSRSRRCWNLTLQADMLFFP